MVDIACKGIGGNLSGVSGADALCNAAKPTGVSSAKAFMGLSGVRAAFATDWPFAASTTYYRPDGTIVETSNAAAGFSGTLTNSFTATTTENWTGFLGSFAASADSASGTYTNIDAQPCNRNDVKLICIGQ